jgi:hypothetical protein
MGHGRMIDPDGRTLHPARPGLDARPGPIVEGGAPLGPSLRLGLLATTVILLGQVLAQQPRPVDEKVARLGDMARLAAALKVRVGEVVPRLRADPILRYDDPPRGQQDATLWIWEESGRPVAALKVERYPGSVPEARWVEGVVTLAERPLSVSSEDGLSWEATRPGMDRREFPGFAAPAATGPGRLAQMKELARRLTGHEVDGPERGRLQLRLLPTPIHRYSDPAHGLIDGAIFGLAFGTNPEVLILLEARSDTSGPARWSYSLARLGGAEGSVSLDGKEVWTVPYVRIPARQPLYMNRFVPEK